MAVICHSLQVLTAAGVMKGRKVTAYPAVGPELTLAGAQYCGGAGGPGGGGRQPGYRPCLACAPRLAGPVLEIPGVRVEGV